METSKCFNDVQKKFPIDILQTNPNCNCGPLTITTSRPVDQRIFIPALEIHDGYLVPKFVQDPSN